MLISTAGLDPAGPMYGTDVLSLLRIEMPSSVRLDPTDAQYVQCIETSILGISVREFSCGHANFVVYDGGKQPHCARLNLQCNHAAARVYFKRSLNPGYKLIGYDKIEHEIGDGICLCKSGRPIDITTAPKLYEYGTEPLGIYNTRTRGFFYIDGETTKQNSPFHGPKIRIGPPTMRILGKHMLGNLGRDEYS